MPDSRSRVHGWAALLAVALLVACAGPPTRESPADLPPVEAAWADLTYQLPMGANVVFLVSLDASARAELSDAFAAVDAVSNTTTRMGDVLGLDLTTASAFDRLGLRENGGAAIAIDGAYWLVLADLADASATRDVLEGMAGRNPDLRMSWREVDGEDVLGIVLPDGGERERLHMMVTNEQLVLVYDRGETGSRQAVDAYLTEHRQPVTVNVRFNTHFVRAVTDLGGSTWGLFIAEVPALFEAMTALGAPGTGRAPLSLVEPGDDDQAGGLFGPPPSPERCRQASRAVGVSVPVIDGSIERELLPETASLHEVQRLRLHVSPARREEAAALLRPPLLDRDALGDGAMLAGFLRLDRDALVRDLAEYSDAASCELPGLLAGLLGRLGARLGDESVLGEQVDGLVAGALFDLRNAGGMPFADFFVGLGAEEPAALSQSVQQILEDLSYHGTPEVVAGLPTVHYRFALLYRLTLLEGDHMLGLTMGLVDERWQQALLRGPTEPSDAFLWLRLDGEAMQPVYDTVLDFALMDVDDEELAESQGALLEESMAELRRLRYFEVTGQYDAGVVDFRIDQVTAAE